MDEDLIIDEVASILRRPSDRETERWRYMTWLLEEGCSWRAPEELDAMPASVKPIPLFGGPPDEHYPRYPDEHPPRGVPLSDLGCRGCCYLYNTVTDHLLVYDDSRGEYLIAEARRGDRDADAVLCIIAAKHTRAGSPLPQYLGGYVTEILERRVRDAQHNEGGNRHANFTRNLTIYWAVGLLHKHYGIKDKARAIRVVHKALEKIGLHISIDGIRLALKRLPQTAKSCRDTTSG